MMRSRQLGIVSAVLLGSVFVPPFSNWREPVSFASVGISAVLGLLAARQGSKWWLLARKGLRITPPRLYLLSQVSPPRLRKSP